MGEVEIWQNRLNDLIESRRLDVNEIVRTRTQENVSLAADAVNLILKDRIMCNILERKTDLKLDTLTMDDWRQNAELREAVLMKIENIRPDDFQNIQNQYDLSIKKARSKIKHLQELLQNLL